MSICSYAMPLIWENILALHYCDKNQKFSCEKVSLLVCAIFGFSEMNMDIKVRQT